MAEQKRDERDTGDSSAAPLDFLPRRSSGLAHVALNLGVLSFCTIGLFAIPGLIVGVIALARIRNSGGRLTGQVLVVAGIVLSGISGIALVYFVVNGPGMLPGLGSWEAASETRCRANLRQIAQATQVWATEHGDEGAYYPSSMRALYDDGVIEDTRAFFCPASDTEPQPGQIGVDYESLLDIVGERIPARLVDEAAVPLVWDKTADRHGGVLVGYFDQHVRWYRDDDALEQVHRKVEAWLNTYEAAKQEKAEAEESP